MPGLHDVEVKSPIGSQKVADAMHAELDELTGRLTLLRDVHVTAHLVLNEEYTITSQAPTRTLLARYAGRDHANPGALVFGVVPTKSARTSGRI